MDPKKIFDTKQTELELDDASDAGLIEVLYKLNNPSTSAEVIQPTTLKNYLPNFRERMETRWQLFQTNLAYRNLVLKWGGASLVALLLVAWMLKGIIAPAPLAMNEERLADLQANAKVLQKLVENYSVDLLGYPAELADLDKAGNLKDYNVLRTNPLTNATGSAESGAWAADGMPAGTPDWIGKVSYASIKKEGKVVGYRIMLGDDTGQPVKIGRESYIIVQNAGSDEGH